MLDSNTYFLEEAEIYKQTPGKETEAPVRFGHRELDKAIPGGVPIFTMGAHLVQGASGSRKTTFVLNMMLNMLFSPNLPKGFRTYWWSIESLMTQEHVMTLLRTMIATRIVTYKRFNYATSWELLLGDTHKDHKDYKEFKPGDVGRFRESCVGVKERVWSLISDHSVIPTDHLGSPDPIKSIRTLGKDVAQTAQFVKSWHKWRGKYMMPEELHVAHILAGYCMSAFDFYAQGTSEHANRETRAIRQFRSDNLKLVGEEWLKDARECDGNCQFVIDHVTAFEMSNTSEYEKQRALKPYLKAVFSEYPLLFWIIIQDGVGNQRDRQLYGRSFGSMGGDVLRQEVNVNWSKRLQDESNMHWDVLERPDKSRIGMHPALAFMVIPGSGAYIGEAQLASKVML